LQDEEQIVTECRVRYLSFLGIGKDVKQCAFIMHTAQDLFIAHVFHCEPSSGALCKTIEAACKVGAFVPSFVHPRPKSFQCMHLIIPRIGNLPMSLFLTIRLFIILNLQFLKILFKTRYFCGF